jgi:hypothetical protein
MDDGLVVLRLTGHAGANARQSLATTGGDRLSTVFAVFKPLARGHSRARRANGIVHRVVDLILDCTVA